MNTALAAGLSNATRYFVAASSNGGSSGLQATVRLLFHKYGFSRGPFQCAALFCCRFFHRKNVRINHDSVSPSSDFCSLRWLFPVPCSLFPVPYSLFLPTHSARSAETNRKPILHQPSVVSVDIGVSRYQFVPVINAV
jgi:hypothetical protein